MEDVVTITLYSKQVKGDPPYSKQLFGEKKNIQNIMTKLTEAAKKERRDPPKFVLSVNLVPDWSKEDNSYKDLKYLADKEAFLNELATQFKDLTQLKIKDFYTTGNLTEDEKAFMHKLYSGGSNADIIKTKAIINNSGNRHLQIDSNSIIHSFDELYKSTFVDKSNTMTTNANYYMWFNVSANNKVVYTPPNNNFTEILANNLQNVLNKRDPQDKISDSNSVYEKAYNPALESIGVTKKVVITREKQPNVYAAKDIFVVKIPSEPNKIKEHPLRITNNVIVAVNMSWNTKPESELKPDEIKANEVIKKLNALPSIQVGDGACNFPCFNYLIKKYTAAQLTEYYTKLQSKMSTGDVVISKPELQGFIDVVGAVDDLRNYCTDEKLDSTIMIEFYNQACKKNPEIIPDLVALIPLTAEGNKLSEKLFGINRKELGRQIEDQATLPVDRRNYPKAHLPEVILDSKLEALANKTKEITPEKPGYTKPNY